MSSSPIVDRIRIIPRPQDFLNRNVGASGEVFFNSATNSLRVYSGKDRGGFEIAKTDLTNVGTAAFRLRSVESRLATVIYTVTVVGPQAPDVGNKYVLNGVYRLIPNFVVGYTYVFNQNDATNVYFPNASGTTVNAHPLNFSADNISGERGGGTSYTTDVEYKLNGITVTQAAYNSAAFNTATARQVQITITNSTPATLYYWCYYHALMGNEIAVADPGSGGGGVSVSVADTVPSSPNQGSLWLDTTTGSLYVYYDDGDSEQWIQPAFPFPDISSLATVASLSPVATSGNYNDLINTPDLSALSSVAQFSFAVAADDSTQRSIFSENLIKFIGAGGVTTSSDADGNITITGGATTGDVTFAGTNIDSSDSSAITITPAVVMQSDLTVENDLIVNNLLTTTSLIVDDILLQGDISTQGSTTPEIVSDNEIYITPGTTTILNGLTTFYQTTEVINTKTGATGTVVHDFYIGSLFLHTSLAANFTANFTNVPTTNNRSITVALILDQGATAYIPNAVQINGGAETIKWSGGSVPSGTINYTDIVNFTLIRSSGSWTVLGSLSTYN